MNKEREKIRNNLKETNRKSKQRDINREKKRKRERE